VLGRFGRRVVAAGRPYSGFSIDTKTAVGPTGVAWEFTGQAVVMMDFADALYGVTTFAKEAALYLAQLAQAQGRAPFGDGSGLVASTMARGDTLAPGEQCLTTPFQCIPERVGLAATSWAIFAAKGINPLAPPAATPLGPQACQTTTPPAISFSFVPPLLSPANVQGNVAFTTTPCIAKDFSVALFIQVPGFTGSSYICKPYEDAPLTPIANDGSWTAAYATGGMDVEATEIWAFLVAPGFTWPCFADTLPTVDGSSVFAVVSVDR
jgi:hypothetical protein